MSEPLQHFEGKYEIITKLAEGGMGAVYKVRHRLLDEIRVIKVMRPQIEDQSQSKSRFLREARIAVKVKHDNIAQMYDFSVDDSGTAFIVMEFIDGVTLQGVLKKAGPPTVALALEIAVQSLQALGYLHRKGIVHRDISPDNLMLTKDDHEEPLVKLIDLGIAKLTGGESNLTGTGVFLGKVRYASPEHFKSQEGVEVSPVSDIYSFGLVLYELLTGRHPIKGSGWSEMIAGHLFQPPLDFAESDPDNRIPEPLRKIVLRSLAKAPEDRYPDAKSFRAAIREVQGDFTRFPDDLQYVLNLCYLGVRKEPAAKPGSTQDRLDEQFQAGLTGQATRVESDGSAAVPQTKAEERLTALIQAAEKLVDLSMHAEARIQLNAALQVDPENQRAKGLQARIEEAERWAEALSQVVGKAESLIEAGELNEAFAVIESGVRRLGDADQLLTLRARVDEARALERRQAVEAALAEGRRFLERGEPQQAVERLEQALQLEPERSDIGRQLEQARAALRKHEDEVRQQRAVAGAVAEIEAKLGASDLEGAQAKLGEAAARLGDVEALRSLRERLDTLRQQRLAARVASLDEQGQALLARGEPEQAMTCFDQALAVDPSNPVLQAHRASAKQSLEKARQRQLRQGKIDEVVSEVETHLRRDRVEEAEARLREAIDLLGSADEFGVLDTKIRKVRDRQRATVLETLLTQAQALSARGKHELAVAKLEEALAANPGDANVQRRLAEARQATRSQRAEAPTTRMEAVTEKPEVSAPQRKVAAQVPPATQAAAGEAPSTGERAGRDTLPLGYRAPVGDAPTTRLEADATVSEAPLPPTPPRSTVAPPEPAPPPPVAARPQVKPEPRAAARPLPLPKRPAGAWKVWAGVAAALAVVAVAGWLTLGRGGKTDGKGGPGPGELGPPGTLVVNALPWGELVRIEDARGVEQALPQDRYTPLWLSLPAGRYRLSLRSPSGADPVVIEADITAGQTARAEQRFNPPDAEQLLAKYGL